MSNVNDPVDVTRFDDRRKGVKDMRNALKATLEKEGVKTLLIIATPTDEVQADGSKPPYTVEIYSNTSPLRLILGLKNALQDATDRFENKD